MVNSLFKKMFVGVVAALTAMVQLGAEELPVKCREFECSVIQAKDFKRITAFAKYGLELLDDAEAVSGKAMALRKHPSGKDLHKLSYFDFGIYDNVSKKTLLRLRLQKDKLPQDEKYHFVRIGRVTLTRSMIIYAHPSWAMQQTISSLYDAGNPDRNIVDVYASIKFTGPAYVKNSAKENAIFIDQLLFAHTGLPGKSGTDSLLPAELQGKVIRYIDANDFSTYRRFAKNGMKRVDDKDSIFGKAITLGENKAKPDLHKGSFVMGIYSNKTKKNAAYKVVKSADIPKDEKYHLISLGKCSFDDTCYFWGHRSWVMQQSMYLLADKDAAKNSGEVFVSIKFTGPSYVPGSTSPDGVFIDRIVLVR